MVSGLERLYCSIYVQIKITIMLAVRVNYEALFQIDLQFLSCETLKWHTTGLA